MTNFFSIREPEPHVTVVPSKSDYCAVDLAHSKCLYSTPNPRCNIIKRVLSDPNKAKFIEKINE